MYYCKFCNKTKNMNSKIKHNYSKSHLYLANYIIEEEIYHKINLKNVEKIIFECGNRYKYKFNEFCIKVKCEINNKLTTTQKERYYILPNYGFLVNGILERYKESDETLQEISKKIYDKNHSVLVRNDVKSIYNLKKENLSIKLIADYDKMTLYHRLLQPRLVSESQLIKHKKNNKKLNRRSFAFLVARYELS